MPDSENGALWHALNRLIMNYWAEVDYNAGEKAHEFYVPDALYSVGNNRFEGIEKIRAFYERRRRIGNSTTRHLITNLRVFADERAQQARAAGIMTLYRADGRPPFRGVKPPSMIADFEVQCALGDGPQWRFRSHLLRPIFVSSDLPVSITIDPQRL
jgi:hypothetical protein